MWTILNQSTNVNVASTSCTYSTPSLSLRLHSTTTRIITNIRDVKRYTMAASSNAPLWVSQLEHAPAAKAKQSGIQDPPGFSSGTAVTNSKVSASYRSIR